MCVFPEMYCMSNVTCKVIWKVRVSHDANFVITGVTGGCHTESSHHEANFVIIDGTEVYQRKTWTVFCLLLGVSSDYAPPITGQVTEVTCHVIGRAQPQLTPSKRQKTGPDDAKFVVTVGIGGQPPVPPQSWHHDDSQFSMVQSHTCGLFYLSCASNLQGSHI